MFDKPVELRLSQWLNFRHHLSLSHSPLEDVVEFWKSAPFIPFNRHIDPFYQSSWPSPWEIIERNIYDDFTKALMMAFTLKLSTKFADTHIEIHTVLDNLKSREYNLVCVDHKHVLNYLDSGITSYDSIPDQFHLRNMVVIKAPR